MTVLDRFLDWAWNDEKKCAKHKAPAHKRTGPGERRIQSEEMPGPCIFIRQRSSALVPAFVDEPAIFLFYQFPGGWSSYSAGKGRPRRAYSRPTRGSNN